ncbi:hypothetical protein SDC9_140112 [bioreactor metagenome]|uniref:Uncharacterized protein n=1 Tax=bioreactor metagenome TaxID=1076179 RepID=A0A645DUE7_9ZZZZ
MRIALHLFFRREEKASRNIGVHAGSAYLLAVLVDDKRIYIFKSDLRHSRGSLFKQFRLAGEHILRQDGLKPLGLMIGVVDQRHGEEHPCIIKENFRRAPKPLTHAEDPARLVEGDSAPVFSEANDHHLTKAAFYGAAKIGMGLHTAAHHDIVCAVGVRVAVYLDAFGRMSEHHGVHRGHDRHFKRIFRHAKRSEHLYLSLRGTAAVTAHRRNDEGLCAPGAQLPADRAAAFHKVGDAAAAGRDGDAFSPQLGKRQLRYLFAHGAVYIRDVFIRKPLLDLYHFGEAGKICLYQFITDLFIEKHEYQNPFFTPCR